MADYGKAAFDISSKNSSQIGDLSKNVSDITQCRFPKTYSKLKTGKGVKVLLIGDSLMSTGSWYKRLFDNDYMYQSHNIKTFFNNQNITYDNWGLGGSTSHHLVAQISNEMEIVKDDNSTPLKIGGVKTSSNILNNNYDLVIISIGTNGGTEKEYFAELFVRFLRKHGIEVMLMTANPTKSGGINSNNQEPYLRNIAVAYGCALIDTHKSFRDYLNNGGSLDVALGTGDDVHPNATIGAEIYAQTAFEVFTRPYKESANPSVPMSNIYAPVGVNYFNFPAFLEPVASTGNVVTMSYASVGFNPKKINSKAWELTAGQYCEFFHDDWNGFDVISNALLDDNSVELQINNNGSWVAFKTMTLYKSDGIPWTNEGKRTTDVITSILGGNEFTNKKIRVVCISGKVRITGVVFFARAKKQFLSNRYSNFENIDLSGDWEKKYYKGISLSSTKALNNSFAVDFFGDGINVMLSSTSDSGNVVFNVDGAKSNEIIKSSSNDLLTTKKISFDRLGIGKHKLSGSLNTIGSLSLISVDVLLGDNYNLSECAALKRNDNENVFSDLYTKLFNNNPSSYSISKSQGYINNLFETNAKNLSVKGKSLKSYAYSNINQIDDLGISGGTMTVIDSDTVEVTTSAGQSHSEFGNAINLSSKSMLAGETYTISIKVNQVNNGGSSPIYFDFVFKDNNNAVVGVKTTPNANNNLGKYGVFEEDKFSFTIPTGATKMVFRLAKRNSPYTNAAVVQYKDLMILKGDWTNVETPSIFYGTDSIGLNGSIAITTTDGVSTNTASITLNNPLRSTLDGSVFDEINGETITRRVDSNYAILSTPTTETLVINNPIKLFDKGTNISVDYGSKLFAKISFDYNTSLLTLIRGT